MNENETVLRNVECYEQKIPEITAISDEALITWKNIPVGIYIQEAENLYKWVQTDRNELTARGLDWELVEEIPLRAVALREAESRWITQRYRKKQAGNIWKKRAPEVLTLRNRLLHDFRFAYRGNAFVLGRVKAIAGNQTYADMIQDLNDLAVLGKTHPGELAQIGFDPELLHTAAELAAEMAVIFATTNSDRDYNQAGKIRDQAYTLLKWAVDEVKAFGRYIFWKDAQRKRGYTSDYMRRRKPGRSRSRSLTQKQPLEKVS